MSLLSPPLRSSRPQLKRPSQKVLRFLSATPPIILACFGVETLLLVAALAAPLLAPFDIPEQSLLARLEPPIFLGGTLEHVLGTDQLGRDVLSRLLYALRTSLGVASLGMVIGLTLGTGLGLVSGLVGKWLDTVIMFLVDTQSALPFTLLALTAVALFGTAPTVLIAIIGLAGWDKYARVVRGQVLATRQLPYIEASRARRVELALGRPPRSSQHRLALDRARDHELQRHHPSRVGTVFSGVGNPTAPHLAWPFAG